MSWAQAFDLMSLAGIALLSVPVLALDRRKALVAPKGQARPIGQGAEALAREADARRDTWLNAWRRRDRICLWAGYALLLSSAAGRVFV